MPSNVFHKPLKDLRESDIQQLIENGVPESRTLEYKERLPGTTDGEKKEYLRDISSFANASGGVLVFGVATKREGDTRIPERITGLPGLNPDETIRRLGDTMRTGLDPGLSWVEWQVIPTTNPGPVLVLRVPASILGPHMITFQGLHEFWRRGPASRHKPDIQELRQMFLTGPAWLDQVDRFRRDRVDGVRGGLFPDLDLSSSFFLHILPMGRLDGLIDLRPHEEKLRTFPPLTRGGWNHDFNTFGFLTYSSGRDKVRSCSSCSIFLVFSPFGED